MAREDLHFRLRIPEDLKAKIEQAATENSRSMTAEIVFQLREYDRQKLELEDAYGRINYLMQELLDDRARLREIMQGDEAIPALVEEKQQEIDDMRRRLAEVGGINSIVEEHTERAVAELRKDLTDLRRELEKLSK